MRAVPTTKLLSEQEAIPGLGIRVQRNTLPDYATDDFWEAVQMWKQWRSMKIPPNAGGSMDQPCLWWDVVSTMEQCNENTGG